MKRVLLIALVTLTLTGCNDADHDVIEAAQKFNTSFQTLAAAGSSWGSTDIALYNANSDMLDLKTDIINYSQYYIFSCVSGNKSLSQCVDLLNPVTEIHGNIEYFFNNISLINK